MSKAAILNKRPRKILNKYQSNRELLYNASNYALPQRQCKRAAARHDIAKTAQLPEQPNQFVIKFQPHHKHRRTIIPARARQSVSGYPCCSHASWIISPCICTLIGNAEQHTHMLPTETHVNPSNVHHYPCVMFGTNCTTAQIGAESREPRTASRRSPYGVQVHARRLVVSIVRASGVRGRVD